MKKLVILFLIAIFCVCCFAGEDVPMVKITEHHKLLHDGVGKWNVLQKIWMAPNSKPITVTGTSVCKLILDGRATIVTVETKSPDPSMPSFKGFGVFTWNTITKKYSASWVDTYSYNGIDAMVGTYDKAKDSMTWTSMMTMPDGSKIPFKMVEKAISKDKVVSKFFMPGKDGKEFMMMENTYTRAK